MRHWLIHHRRNRNLTQMLVAMQAGISRAYYTQLELAQRDPSVKIAKRLGNILEFDWHRFFEENLEINQPESITV
jgi:transcriptional regulator with XRE-family HTH domain